MGQVSSFTGIFITFFYVAIGAALFKPIISATIARTTDESNSSVGFGFFYMIVNIGGLVGPLVASELREVSWTYVFIMSGGAILLNMIIVLIFYREPERSQEPGPFMEGLRQAFQNIYFALKDMKFTLFLLIIISGWTVYWQFFYSLPVYIEQWIDTGVIYQGIHGYLPRFADALATSDGTILAEKLITLGALFIVFFQIIMSGLVMRFKPINTMIATID